VRSPSEGVFNFSFDEESSSSSSEGAAMGEKARELVKMKMLFGAAGRERGGVRRGREARPNGVETAERGEKVAAEKEKEKEKAASLYASSLFQNSPSPDDLPPPAF
jgi:hypothetical protein